jgi:hypothetical protein
MKFLVHLKILKLYIQIDSLFLLHKYSLLNLLYFEFLLHFDYYLYLLFFFINFSSIFKHTNVILIEKLLGIDCELYLPSFK